MSKVVLRFAPSPTGMLHVGGARTALFNYYMARRTPGSKFVLRIEDTDTERSKQEYTDEILASMKWLGLEWDADPIYQTQRFDLYRDYVAKMLKAGTAYKCWCTPEELEAQRTKATAEGRKPMYDRTYRDYKGPDLDKPFVVRFKAPLTGVTVLKDLIKGDITFNNEEIDDFVILRSNNAPTYNFTVVVDDVEMGITTVIRGDDHVNNTPKQIMLIEAMGLKAPQYAHVPMILGPDKVKLSKRHGAVAVTQYRELGYLPEAMRNYLIRLGWSHGDQEKFSDAELKQVFDLEHCGSSPSVFDTKKLDWLNQQYIQEKSIEDLAKLLKETYSVDLDFLLMGERNRKMFDALKARATRMTDFAGLVTWIKDFKVPADDKALMESVGLEGAKKDTTQKALKALSGKLSSLSESDFNAAKVFETLKATATELGLKIPDLAKPCRVLLTGTLASPDLGLCFEYLGKAESLKRLG